MKSENLTNYLNRIKNDKTIIAIYEKIHEYEDAEGGYAYHDYNHVNNVANYCEKILKSLKYDDDFICEAKIAALLHDTGCTKGKENHAQRSYEFAKKYIEENNIPLKNKDLVLDAIKNHSDGFTTDNIMQLVIILADKIDIKGSRISEAGKQLKGNRQYQYINDIQFEIINNNFYINFICDENIDLEELNNYYFTKKVFKAIKSFSDKLNLSPKVSINNKRWKEFYK